MDESFPLPRTAKTPEKIPEGTPVPQILPEVPVDFAPSQALANAPGVANAPAAQVPTTT